MSLQEIIFTPAPFTWCEARLCAHNLPSRNCSLLEPASTLPSPGWDNQFRQFHIESSVIPHRIIISVSAGKLSRACLDSFLFVLPGPVPIWTSYPSLDSTGSSRLNSNKVGPLGLMPTLIPPDIVKNGEEPVPDIAFWSAGGSC